MVAVDFFVMLLHREQIMGMNTTEDVINYIKNNDGVVKKSQFMEDFEPIGDRLIAKLYECGEIEMSTSGSTTILFLSESNGNTV